MTNDFSTSIAGSFGTNQVIVPSMSSDVSMSIPLQAYASTPSVTAAAFPNQQQHSSPQLMSPSYDQITSSTHQIPNGSFQNTVVGSLQEQWNPPSINDAIATNKIGFKENNTNSLLTATTAMDVVSSNNFLNNLQQISQGNTTGLQLDTNAIFSDANIPQTRIAEIETRLTTCLLYTSPSPRDS